MRRKRVIEGMLGRQTVMERMLGRKRVGGMERKMGLWRDCWGRKKEA